MLDLKAIIQIGSDICKEIFKRFPTVERNIVFDAIQDAFLTLICESTPINESTFIPIFKKIVYYNILKYLRRKKEQCIDPNELDKILQYNRDYYAEEERNELYSEQLYSILIQAKQGLKESEVRLITLRYWENKNIQRNRNYNGDNRNCLTKASRKDFAKITNKNFRFMQKIRCSPLKQKPCQTLILSENS